MAADFVWANSTYVCFIKCKNKAKSCFYDVGVMVWSEMGSILKSTVSYNCRTKLLHLHACRDLTPFLCAKEAQYMLIRSRMLTAKESVGKCQRGALGLEAGTGALSRIYPPTPQTAIPQHKTLPGFIRDEHYKQFLLLNIEHHVIFPRCTVLQFLNDWSMMPLTSPNCYYTSWSTTVEEMCLSLRLLISEEI